MIQSVIMDPLDAPSKQNVANGPTQETAKSAAAVQSLNKATELPKAKKSPASGHVAKGRPTVIGISGCTRCGKGTLSKGLVEALSQHHRDAVTLCQDRFASPRLSARAPSGWEDTASIDHSLFRSELSTAMQLPGVQLVIVEGFRAFHDPMMVEQMDALLWLEVGKQACHDRRMATTKVTETVFRNHLWPRHLEYQQAVFGPGGAMETKNSVVIDAEQTPEVILEEALQFVCVELNLLAAPR